MQKITVLGKKITLPLPFRTNSELGISDYKIKIPKKSKLLGAGVSKDQFCQEVAEYFNDEYSLNGLETFSRSNWVAKRGYLFLSVTTAVSN